MYFNEKMSHSEALQVLYTIVNGKSKEEKEKIKAEYSKVIEAITERELKKSDWCMTNY